MEQDRRITVQTISDATIGDNTLASITVFKTTVYVWNDATVSDNDVPENILNGFLNVSQKTPAKITKMI